MKTEWQKFIDLLNEMFKAPKQNTREIIILLGLYGEYIANTLIEQKCSKRLYKELETQDIRLKVLRELEAIEESEYDVFSKLSSIRNKYAHKLELSQGDMDSITQYMKDITINWDEKNEEDPKSLEKMMREKPFLKFQLACITKIGYFLTKFGREKGEEINQTIILDINIDGKIHKFKML